MPLDDELAQEPSLVRVLLVDDHPMFRAGVRQRLGEHDQFMEVVGEAENATEAVELAARVFPDVVLMDIAMPGGSAIEATRKIKSVSPGSAVVILSLYDDVQYIEAAVKAGATGYLLKTVRGAELAKATRSAAAGELVLGPELSTKMFQQMVPPGGGQSGLGHQLSEREVEVLLLVARGVANKEVARLMRLSVRTVEAHLRSIFSKLNAFSRTEAVMLAVRAGLLRLDEVDFTHAPSD